MTEPVKTERDARIMGAALVGMGVLHFAVPKPFDDQIPREFPGKPRTLTYASGVAEAAIGAGLLVPTTRRLSALAAVALFLAVFPANVNMVRLYWDKPMLRAGALARLPFQIPMITTAVRIYRKA
ncbi:MAG: hypothetical protein WBF79_14620 [Rhodococcus sp. (in: high G+C Gram-positive bacteria)]